MPNLRNEQNMMTSRQKIIKLAHNRPALRPYLLPLVSDKIAAGMSSEMEQAVSQHSSNFGRILQDLRKIGQDLGKQAFQDLMTAKKKMKGPEFQKTLDGAVEEWNQVLQVYLHLTKESHDLLGQLVPLRIQALNDNHFNEFSQSFLSAIMFFEMLRVMRAMCKMGFREDLQRGDFEL